MLRCVSGMWWPRLPSSAFTWPKVLALLKKYILDHFDDVRLWAASFWLCFACPRLLPPFRAVARRPAWRCAFAACSSKQRDEDLFKSNALQLRIFDSSNSLLGLLYHLCVVGHALHLKRAPLCIQIKIILGATMAFV